MSVADGPELAEVLPLLGEAAERSFRDLASAGLLRDGATLPALSLPRTFAGVIARALELERREGSGREQAIVRHYFELMPAMRVEQLATRAHPNEPLFHTRLDWARLPRLSGAIDRLFALLAAADVSAEGALGAADADAFRAARPTLAALYERTYYGGFMPLLYGYPTDLAYVGGFLSRGEEVHAVIDRYLTAPVLHELMHLDPGRRAIEPPYFDECIAGWLGVHLLPEFAYPAPGEENALFAAPWFAQVGQALARVTGLHGLVRAHAGVEPWDAALPGSLARTAGRLGWEDYRARRPLHFLTDNFRPDPWLKLIFLAAAGIDLDGATLESLAATPWDSIPTPPEVPMDAEIATDALRAMCLRNYQNERSFRVRARPAPAPIDVDLEACRVSTAPGEDGHDPAPPSYLFPPSAASRLRREGRMRLRLELESLDAIPAAAAALLAGGIPSRGDGYRLDPVQ